MSIRRILIVSTLISLGLGGSLALAESTKLNSLSSKDQNSVLAQSPTPSPSPNPAPKPPRKPKGGFAALNLTEEQKNKITEIRQKYREQMSQNQQSLRSAQQEFSQMLSGSTSDSEIRSKHQEISKLRQTLDDLNLQSMLEIRSVLTPEQRAQLNQMRQQHRANKPNRPNNPAAKKMKMKDL